MDEYVRQNTIQNNGGVCEHCGSAIGHYNVCPLINRTIAEARNGAAQERIARFEECSSELFRKNVHAGFYRIPYKGWQGTKQVPELVLTEEDERFLKDINKAFE